ncbi:YqiA/YcfP family alpha/beta fold hydrolase [Bordetella bronchialis]|uniref:YqiA/YcfP family alpha/beta fold hydrolase n=1 Tax=Bordetella bronchialis TaxID=463025 RepID=UPI003D03F85A
MILYLHGFRSSPASFKARMLADEMARRGLSADWRCPQLPPSPREAADLAMSLAREQLDALSRQGRTSPRALTVIGSSLGGYYATWLAEQLDCKAVLLNPAVHAPRDLATQVGRQSMYHSGAPFDFRPEYVDELAALAVQAPTRPERYFLIAATGDEVLDWREMRDWYAGCRQRIVEGSDHGLSDFAVWMPEVLQFALDTPPAPTGPDQ